MFYHPPILDFIYKLFDANNQSRVSEVITKTKTVIQCYLAGLIVETIIIAILETVTLLLLGIVYALLPGAIVALPDLNPNIGGIVSVALPMIVALITKSYGWYVVYVYWAMPCLALSV